MYSEFKRGAICPCCGREHQSSVKEIVVGNGVVKYISDYVRNYKKVFVLADINTYAAAGEKVSSILNDAGVVVSEYVFENTHVEPNEEAVGSALMHFDANCDAIVAVGSGVINDIGKILSHLTNKPYIIAATTPSMDGYASATSSVSMDGLKVSLPSKAADVIIGDIDILKNVPDKLLKAGLGDMLTKYISICEWRISNLLIGEYYCENIASLVRSCLKKCTDNVDGLLKRDDEAVKSVCEGLVTCGMAMEYVGISRSASGVEHYISHIWDMRGLSKGTPVDFHGIQCAIGTLASAEIYEHIIKIVLDRKKAIKFVNSFNLGVWNNALVGFIENGVNTMIALEKKEQKYNLQKHSERLDKIITYWDKIVNIISEELPPSATIERILDTIHAPKSCAEIGIDKNLMPMTFKASKDIRDKYVLSRLWWDLGIIDEIASNLSI